MRFSLKGRIPRAFRQLEFGLMIVAVVFLGQLLWVSMRLHETENRPVVDSEKDLSKVFYRDNVVKQAELIASEKPAPLQGEAGAIGVGKSAGKGLKKESQDLQQLPTSTASKSAEEDIKKKEKKDRRRRRRKNWDPGIDGLKGDPIPLKINLPVFVPSLPKSGTTSIWQYFNCKCGNTSRHEMTFRTPFSHSLYLISLHLNFRWWAPSLSPVGKGQRD
jgi:hypothetical protein